MGHRIVFSSITAFSLIGCVTAAELQPSFPNYAAAMPAAAGARANPATPETPEPPFSWTQYAVVREGGTYLRYVTAYDPGSQPTEIVLPNTVMQRVDILATAPEQGLLQFKIPADSAPFTEALPFQVRARGITSDTIFQVVFDVRDVNSRVRATPFLMRSPGDVVRPGQVVRYTWTKTGAGEKRPKVEAEFSGKTGVAAGVYSSNITEVLAVKVQPFALGHYLMTVTPRDVRGEPPRGPTSNGLVFRCAFGSENLPPVTDGFAADTFLPGVGQTIFLQPVAVDPETGRSTFDNQVFDFGDGAVVSGVSGQITHAYGSPGIYRVRCTVADDQGLAATAEDNVIVGAQTLPTLSCAVLKNIVPEEAGVGEAQADTISVTFTGANASPGDRIVFAFNRNRFGRMFASDGSDETDIVLKAGGGFTGATKLAKTVSVRASGGSVSIAVTGASLDRTGDPRFGRAELKGIFKRQRIALCVIPADGSAPRVLAYTGNMQIKVKGGNLGGLRFVPEFTVRGTATTKEPDPRKQEPY